MGQCLREDPYVRRFRQVMLAIFILAGLVGLAVAVSARSALAVLPIGWIAFHGYVLLSTVHEVEDLGGSVVQLRRPPGRATAVRLADELDVRESWAGPGMLYLVQGARRHRMWGTLGAAVAVEQWLRAARRRGLRHPGEAAADDLI
jgi:hypothetical protein